MSNISELNFDNKNFNKHTEYGMSLLEKSLRENGGGRSILLDKNNNIIAGNGIVEAAGNIGLEDVQIIESDGKKLIAVKRTDIDLDSKQGREMALADNATAEADLNWDEDAIKIESEKWGFDPGDWLGNEWPTEQKEIEEDEAPEIDESEPPKSELGKVYKLGEHRLMCGDSTDAGNVAILMDGQKADMVFTDPPYGVSYTGGVIHGNKINVSHKREMLKNDDADIYCKFVPILNDVIDDGAIYIFYATCNSYELLKPLRDNGIELNSILVWNKVNTGYADMNSNYKNKYEPCFYGRRQGHKLNFVGPTTESTVWDIEKDRVNTLHPTQKPIKVPARAIQNSSLLGQKVLDLFGGSGSTLIACEQLGRKCYMMELDPKYCDVIRKRYWAFTHDGNEEGWQEGTPAV